MMGNAYFQPSKVNAMVGQKHSVDKPTPSVILHNRLYSKGILPKRGAKARRKRLKKKKEREDRKDKKVSNRFRFS